MMKKFFNSVLIVICLVLVLFGTTGCTGPKWLAWLPWIEAEEATPEQVPITCSIQFAKTVDEKYQGVEFYDSDVFEINTKIYVIVDFTMINYGDEDDFVEFKIQIPYAKYYSTHEYEKGVIEPHEEYKDVIADDGSVEPMVELSEMVFNVKKGQTPFRYQYCFCIEANQVCENVEFKAVFISDGGIVISRNQSFKKSYSFVNKEV